MGEVAVQQQEKFYTSTEAFRTWRQRSATRRGQLGLGSDEQPWSRRSDTELRGLPKKERRDRVEDVINVIWGDVTKHCREDFVQMERLRSNLFVDVSQSVQRVRGTSGINTLVQGSTLFSYEHDCILTFTQLLEMMGFPVGHFDLGTMQSNIGKQKRAGLVGEAYSMPVVTLVVAALVSNPHAHWMRSQ